MAEHPFARPTTRPLDPVALQQVQRRLHRAGTVPWLHGEVARRMAERLPIVRLQPQTVLVWAAQVGGGLAELQQAYPQARLQAVEAFAPPAAAPRRRWWAWGRGQPAPLAPQALAAGTGQLLWSNMALHGTADPQAQLQQWQQALAVDGFLMFSTLGPGSLQPLQAVYQALGWGPAHAPFVDMHDLGDMMVAAGFADPVMDQETVTLTWPSASAALAELRTLGGNVALQRHEGLRTPRWQQRLTTALAQAAGTPDGRIALPFELVYGHAFKPPPRVPLALQTQVSLDEMRSLVRQGVRRG